MWETAQKTIRRPWLFKGERSASLWSNHVTTRWTLGWLEIFRTKKFEAECAYIEGWRYTVKIERPFDLGKYQESQRERMRNR